MTGKFQFAIDRGGTFTDVWAKCPDGQVVVTKLLSVDPGNYQDAPREGIRRILEQALFNQANIRTVFIMIQTKGIGMPAKEAIDTSDIEWIRMGTTVATNSLLERKGERMALAITKGFRDLLHIGNQARPNIFDLEIITPEELYEDIIEVNERVVLKQDRCEINKPNVKTVTGKTQEQLEVWQTVDEELLRKDLKTTLEKGITSLAVALLHSYTFSDHEVEVGRIAREMGFKHVSLSSDIMPMIRIVPRGFTACADAYLTPCIHQYVKGFSSGFKDGLKDTKVLFMQSDGGLTPVDKFNGSRAILSGPAGGVVGYALTTYNNETKQPVIGFDMGGTSTDVSRYDGQYEHVFETTTAGVTIQAPQLDINTVAAGGGSRLFFRSGMFVVGPESASAHPGPVCYRKGGPLTITDANLCLGRILPEYFPAIFGENENEPLDKAASLKAFQQLILEVNEFLSGQPESSSQRSMTLEEVAMGFIEVANETMCRPIRALTQAKGYDTSRHVLACFGGAGGQHACAIARSLGMSQVFVHRYAGILSAYGMALADVVHETQEPCSKTYQQAEYNFIDSRIGELDKRCREELITQGFSENTIQTEIFLHLRYDRTDCALMVNADSFPPSSKTSRYGDFRSAFLQRYKTEFGFIIEDRKIMVDDIRVRGVGKSSAASNINIPSSSETPSPEKIVKCTILIEPTCIATITSTGDIIIKVRFLGLFTVTTTGDINIKVRFLGLFTITSTGDINIKVRFLGLFTVTTTGDINIKVRFLGLFTVTTTGDIHIKVRFLGLFTVTTTGDIIIKVRFLGLFTVTSTGDINIKIGSGTVKTVGEELDAIQLSIFSHRFMSIAEQMGRVLQRTAISTNIKERLDFSCALFGDDGGLVANAPHIPVHLGAMQETVQYQVSGLKYLF
ncbi:hypothetical protein LOTGIDRAFT_170168 [Lottia gigantea]|uniref:5-oxoprolinase n=1 Tax=Lottia gigantea TaxID=225164 RepID=V3ZIU2_LOTGI|nr:hypothetical protein LOTGIDRAFT_170168 [Lottia gigantea]ESO82255.1 hypothetical protein LOTGIDRAFT_170168 [Lottia gigantea]